MEEDIMAMNERTIAVGVFHDRTEAQQAIAELRRAGFRDDQIGMAARDDDGGTAADSDSDEEVSYAGEGALTGAAAGAGVGALWGLGIVAGLLPAIGPAIAGGTLAAILASAATGAAAAGLAGALIGLGVSKEEAEYYEDELESGRIIVTVHADGRYNEARNILQRFNSYDYSSSAERTSKSTAATITDFDTDETTATHVGSSYTEGDEGAPSAPTHANIRVRPQPTQPVVDQMHSEQRTLEVPVRSDDVMADRQSVGTSRDSSMSNRGVGETSGMPGSKNLSGSESHAINPDDVRIKKPSQKSSSIGSTSPREEKENEKRTEGDIGRTCP
jgi:hypothetical protein